MTKILIPLMVSVLVFAIARYAYSAISHAFEPYHSAWWYLGIKYTYALLHLVLVIGISLSFYQSDPYSGSTAYMKWFGYFLLLFIPELIVVLFLFLEDAFRLILWLGSKWTSHNETGPNLERRKIISTIALGIATVPFTSILYGLVKGKYNYKVKRISLKFKDLPDEFDGFTIAQISDLHTGSFDNMEKVKYGLQLVQDLQADTLVFTGDLVNNKADEAEPYLELFNALEAPFGKYSILGNHDYGDYVNWPSKQEKLNNLEQLKKHHQSMGFHLLLNQRISLKKGEQEMVIAGVENWGKPPFVQYGDLDKTLQGLNPDAFTMLLSHDPSHFDEKVVKHPKKVHLTLSGHTHGMQFGIDLPGIKWSPVKFKYPKWSGLYETAQQFLYVNQGFGYLAFPGRVGMWPEITHITLLKG